MTDIYFYIELPEYLAQWFIHEHGGSPVKLIKGSAEHDIVDLFLQIRPKDLAPEVLGGNKIPVIVPHFRNRDPLYYNYLPPRAVQALIECIRTRFDVQLWHDLSKFGYVGQRKDNIIFAWMEAHGISDCHWEVVAKRYQRKRNAYLDNQRKRKIKEAEKQRKLL